MKEVKIKGIGFIGMLQILFIGLKLCDVIDWSWGIVLLPLWISLGLAFGLILFIVALSK